MDNQTFEMAFEIPDREGKLFRGAIDCAKHGLYYKICQEGRTLPGGNTHKAFKFDYPAEVLTVGVEAVKPTGRIFTQDEFGMEFDKAMYEFLSGEEWKDE